MTIRLATASWLYYTTMKGPRGQLREILGDLIRDTLLGNF